MNTLKMKLVNGLRGLEKYTKTDMLYLAHGGFWLGLDQFTSSGATFLISIAFANLLAPDAYGLYKYVLSILSLLFITTLSGMDPAVTQATARGFEGSLASGVKEKIKFGTIGSFISLCISGYYFFAGNTTLSICFAIVALFLPFGEALDMYNSLLGGKKLFKTQAYFDIIKNIVTVAFLVTALFFTHKIYIILSVYFLSILLPNIFFYFKAKKLASNTDVDPEMIEYGKHLSGLYLIGTFLGELDKILVFHYVGAANLAVYALAVAPNDQVKGLMKNLNSLAMPKLSQRTPEEIKKSIWNKVLLLSLIVSGIVLVYIFLSPLFYTIFFPKYISSIIYSQVFSISLIPVTISGFLYTALESQKAKKELYQYNIWSNVFNIIILFPLVYYFGIWGAILSKVSTRFFTLLLSTRLIRNIS